MRYLICFFIFIISLWAQKPALLLLKEYEDQNVDGWVMSEKLDGVRAYWDGTRLLSRGGNVLAAPSWFTQGFPPFAIDGELWSGRGEFEKITSIVMQKNPHEGWRALRYNIFEVPDQKGDLKARLSVLEQYLNTHKGTFLRIIPQYTCKGNDHLKEFLSDVEKKGGEGVVVRDPSAPYIASRTAKALKVKTFQDAECTVVAVHEGQGKYKGMMGSFTCKDDQGVTFKVGSGLSDEARKTPLALGTKITYKHQGMTANGKPRFPIFLRIRDGLYESN